MIMEYQKIIILLGNTPNQPANFRTRNWIVINDNSRRTNNTNNQIKFKTSMWRTGLCDHSEAYIFIKGTIIINGAENHNVGRRLDGRRKGVIFKFFAPFKECISEINNTQIDNAKYRDVVMPMYNLIEYSDNYSRTSGRLWWYYRNDLNDPIT